MESDQARVMILNILSGLELVDSAQKESLLKERAGDIEFATLGIDSLMVVDLCVALEERLGREIEIEELVENPTLNKLADHFAKGSL